MNSPSSWPPEARAAFHRRVLLAGAPRLLSALNRCPVSASSGSFDREYWAWCAKDFANQDLQRAADMLAWLYVTPLEGNIYHQEPAMPVWLRQAVNFWLRGQARDGAFDHLYPLEKSWVGAAFTLVDMLGAYEAIHHLMDARFNEAWLEGLRGAGRCLTRRDEDHGFISNHRAGAAAGLLALSRVSGDDVFRERALDLLSGILERQSADGFFLEYEGADPGYETLGLHYLAKAHAELELAGRLGPAGAIESAAARSLEFLSYFVHPNGGLGGEYGSRGCPQIFSGGLEYWAKKNPLAESICRRTAPALAEQYAAGPADSDIRNEVPLLSSSLAALEHLGASLRRDHEQVPDLPFRRAFERCFSGAGLYVRSDPGVMYCIFGASKGGVIKLFDNEKLVYSDCGYSAKLGGRRATTHIWRVPEHFRTPLEPGREAPLRETTELVLRTPFIRFTSRREMSTPGLVAFRLFNYTFGRWQFLNGLARRLIIRLFLTRKIKTGAGLERRVRCSAEGLEILDTVRGASRLSSLTRHGFFAAVYMASARYFRRDDFRQAWSEECVLPEGSDEVVLPPVRLPWPKNEAAS
jgi:hypothetical protein